MLVGSIDSGRPAARGATDKVAEQSADSQPASGSGGDPAAPPRASVPPASGLRVFDPQFNQQISAAQRSLDFLEELGGQLQSLQQAAISAVAIPSTASAPVLDQLIDSVQVLWSGRAAATGNTLDSQLNLTTPGQAQQNFQVRGLDVASLSSGAAETLSLSFSVDGRKATASVVLAPELTATEIARRFDKALAPTGVRAALDSAGQLVLRAPESVASSVRDTLEIKGEGRRFPAGQFNRVRSTVEASAIAPDDWSIQAKASPRRLLQDVRNAARTVGKARQAIDEAVTGAATRLQSEQPAVEDAASSAQFAQTFALAGQSSDYASLAAITPAVSGISRQRAVALLSLPG
jgi:hypothetical protein